MKKRYFIVCTVGIEPNGCTTFNLFDVKTNGLYPTHRYLVSQSMILHPAQRFTSITGIIELNEKDFKEFISEQYVRKAMF